MKAWPRLSKVEVDLDFGTDGLFHLGTIATTNGLPYLVYGDEFLRAGVNPAPYSLDFNGGAQRITNDAGHLRSMFSDASPDGWTKDLIDARVAAAGYDPDTLGPIDRLALVGENGAGALSFRPASELAAIIPPLSIEDLAATVARIGEGKDEGIEIAERVAGSFGGARPKALIWWNGDLPTPTPLEGSSAWIVKFPKPSLDEQDIGLVEYAYSLVARAAGITMSETRIVPARGSPGYFATARFDRDAGRRFHYHSFAAAYDRDMLGRSYYSELLQVEGVLRETLVPDEQMIRRMMFNVLAVNRDDHVRNHGFLMRSDGAWAPSPAFDITFEPGAYHKMLIGEERNAPTFADMSKAIGDAGGDVGSARPLAVAIRDVVLEWPTFAKEAGISKNRTEQIQAAIFANMPTDIGPRRRWPTHGLSNATDRGL